MSLRREFMSYVGTGAIGGMAGYYAGAQGLLGIQSDENPTEQQDTDLSEEDERNSAEQDNTGNGNTFSIEMTAGGRTRLSETVTVEDIGVTQPDIVIGTRYSGEGGCDASTYEADISNMAIFDGSETHNITNRVSLQEFNRDDRRNEVYSNPASGSNNWSWSFNITPYGPEFANPHNENADYLFNCAALLHMRLTEYDGERWDRNNWENQPNTIDYYIHIQQPGHSDDPNDTATLRHTVRIFRQGNDPVELLGGNVEDASNPEGYDWYEEGIEWDITITRR